MTPAEQVGIMQQATQGHMSLQAIGETAAHAKVKTVVLSHLTTRRGLTDYTPWADEVRKYYSGNVLIAHDLAEF